VEILPISKDALLGSDLEVRRAAIEAKVGDTDSAIASVDTQNRPVMDT